MLGIGRQGVHIAALAFGIDRIERERRFPAAADARDDNELLARDIDIHVLEIMRPGAPDFYEFTFIAHTIQSYEILLTLHPICGFG